MTERMSVKDYKGGLFPGKGDKPQKPRPITPKESAIQKSIEGHLDTLGIYSDRLNSGKVCVVKEFKDRKTGKWVQGNKYWIRLCKEGTPDLYFIVQGQIYYVEAKCQGGRLSQVQKDRQAELERAGAWTINAPSYESFVEQFHALLPNFKRRIK